MASSGLSAAEAQWREQFAAMQAAIAELKIPQDTNIESDLEDDDFEGYSSGNSGQDVWQFISDDDQDDFSSDFAEAAAVGGSAADYGAQWFTTKCSAIAAKNGLSPDVFETQVMSVLSSGQSEDELQAHLADLVGFDDFDFIIDVLGHKDEIVAAVTANGQKAQQASSGPRLLTRAEREEALRRQDLEHKSASLATASSREPQYPHVYKSYSAGNTLSSTGKKYGLPVGSERKIFDKYEEYSIPAGKKGVLGPGQRLIKISELDGLCRTTFKGYKTLNRMQSLVYPIAHKTSENMLICAPTGAVSFSPSSLNAGAKCSRVKRTQLCSRSSTPSRRM